MLHPYENHLSFRELAAKGIQVGPLTAGNLSDDCVIVYPENPESALDELVRIADRLLGPGGCPWDQEQTHQSLRRHLIEETYEVIDAIDSGSTSKLLEELGDLLLQPIMHAQMRSMAGDFDAYDVARSINEKLIRRHPHVFGDHVAADSSEVLRNWDKIKSEEKGEGIQSRLEGIPAAMPSLLRAYEVSKRAARAGFEWPSVEEVFEKLREELAELRDAMSSDNKDAIEAEIGDLIFTCVNIARWLGIEPENALRSMVGRFVSRFQAMEHASAKPLEDLSLEEWDSLWMRAKADSPAS